MPRKPQTAKPKPNDEAQTAPPADESNEIDDAGADSGADDDTEQHDEQKAGGVPVPTTLIRTYHATDDSGDYAEVLERDGAVIAVAYLGDAVITFTPRTTRNPGSAARQVAAIVARRIAHISIEISPAARKDG